MFRGFSPHDVDVDGIRIHAGVGGRGRGGRVQLMMNVFQGGAIQRRPDEEPTSYGFRIGDIAWRLLSWPSEELSLLRAV